MNGFINLNKPSGMTSFDCIAKLRKILGLKKIGHAGTLDPDACGVLPIAVGKATRLLEYVTDISKEYRAEMTIGIKTNTQDASGEILAQIDSQHISENNILETIPFFVGQINQIPPMFSAIKIGGKRLYELARKNVEVERQPRTVTIYSINLEKFTKGQYPKAIIRVVCSKGTYIRTLIEDIGEKMSSTAHMSYLERIGVGSFKLDTAVTFQSMEDSLKAGLSDFLLPIDNPLYQLGKIYVDEKCFQKLKNGNPIPIEEALEIHEGSKNLYSIYHKQRFIAIGCLIDDKIKVEKVLETEGEAH